MDTPRRLTREQDGVLRRLGRKLLSASVRVCHAVARPDAPSRAVRVGGCTEQTAPGCGDRAVVGGEDMAWSRHATGTCRSGRRREVRG